MTTSVILIDDHELIRQGLRRAFERDPDFDVVGEAGSGGEAREKVQALTPDVVIVDPNDHAVALVWLLTSPEAHTQLTEAFGFTSDQYERWLDATLARTLLQR